AETPGPGDGDHGSGAMRAIPARRAAILAGLLTACAPPPPPPPPPAPPPPPPPFVFPHDTVWTAAAGVELRTDSGSVAVPRPFTALEVAEAEPDSLRVRCGACPGAPDGWIATSEAV